LKARHLRLRFRRRHGEQAEAGEITEDIDVNHGSALLVMPPSLGARRETSVKATARMEPGRHLAVFTSPVG
jgi:hypothetical protein